MLSVLEIGEKIAIARKIKNLSQSQLANLLAVTPQAVGKWERGESMPDIVTFQRLAETLDVELNYFGGQQGNGGDVPGSSQPGKEEPTVNPGWDMSLSNWVDADFSGLRGLAEKFNGANIERCRFVGSELSGLALKRNNMENSDFTRSNLRDCKFSSANLKHDLFIDCDLSESNFARCNLHDCDFSRANLDNAIFKWSDLKKIKLTGAELRGTKFLSGHLADITFDDQITDCSFENCDFMRVEFDGVEIRNTFFKNCKLKRATFTNCKADPISHAFMKSCKADLSGVEILED